MWQPLLCSHTQMNVPATIATPPPASSHRLAALAVVTGNPRATKDKLYDEQEFFY